MTVLFNEGFTEIEPYGFITDTPALGPTVKWYSFLLSARSVPATITPSATIFAERLLTIKQLPQAPLKSIMAENDPWPSQKACTSADTHPSATAGHPRHSDSHPPHPAHRGWTHSPGAGCPRIASSSRERWPQPLASSPRHPDRRRSLRARQPKIVGSLDRAWIRAARRFQEPAIT